MLREFILGSNQTGLVTNSSGAIHVNGGENATLAQPVLSGQAEIFVGSGTTQSSYVFPSATIAAWNSFIGTAAPSASFAFSSTGTGAGSAGPTQTQVNGAGRLSPHWLLPFLTLLVVTIP